MSPLLRYLFYNVNGRSLNQLAGPPMWNLACLTPTCCNHALTTQQTSSAATRVLYRLFYNVFEHGLKELMGPLLYGTYVELACLTLTCRNHTWTNSIQLSDILQCG